MKIPPARLYACKMMDCAPKYSEIEIEREINGAEYVFYIFYSILATNTYIPCGWIVQVFASVPFYSRSGPEPRKLASWSVGWDFISHSKIEREGIYVYRRFMLKGILKTTQ